MPVNAPRVTFRFFQTLIFAKHFPTDEMQRTKFPLKANYFIGLNQRVIATVSEQFSQIKRSHSSTRTCG